MTFETRNPFILFSGCVVSFDTSVVAGRDADTHLARMRFACARRRSATSERASAYTVIGVLLQWEPSQLAQLVRDPIHPCTFSCSVSHSTGFKSTRAILLSRALCGRESPIVDFSFFFFTRDRRKVEIHTHTHTKIYLFFRQIIAQVLSGKPQARKRYFKYAFYYSTNLRLNTLQLLTIISWWSLNSCARRCAPPVRKCETSRQETRAHAR